MRLGTLDPRFPRSRGEPFPPREAVAVFERFTDRARRVVVLAQEEARLLNHNYIGTEHILLGLIHEGEGVAAKALESLGISLEAVRSQVEEIIGQGGSSPSGHIPFTPRAKKVLELSLREALQLGHNYIGTEHILLGLIREGEGVAAQVLVKLGADLSRVRQQVIQLLSGYSGPGAQGGAGEKAGATAGRIRRGRPRRARSCSTSSAATSPSSPARRSSTRSSGASARPSGSCRCCAAAPRTTRCSSASPASARPPSSRAWPRRSPPTTCPRPSPTSSSTRSTSARSSPAPATAATSRSASRRCSRRSRPAATSSCSSTSSTPSSGAGAAEGAIDAASILKPMLARGELQTIGATTLDEYRKHLEKDAALERRFQPIKVEEPTVAHTIEILKGLRDRYESHHRVTITDQALVAAANLADRYISDRHLPDKAIDLIDEAGSRLRIKRMETPPDYKELENEIAEVVQQKKEAVEAQHFEEAGRLRDREKELLAEKEAKEREIKDSGVDLFDEVDEEAIAEVLSIWTGIPVYKLTEEETAKLLRMEDELHKRVIGQERRHQGGLPGHPPHPCRPQGPQAPQRLVHLPGPVGRRQDRAGQDAGRVPLRRRAVAHPARHVRVHGEAHRQPPGGFAPRLRRLRGGRPAHRGRAPQAVLGGALRRDREGPPRRVQHAAADPRGGSPHRQPGPLGRLPQHRADHDLQPRHRRTCARPTSASARPTRPSPTSG